MIEEFVMPKGQWGLSMSENKSYKETVKNENIENKEKKSYKLLEKQTKDVKLFQPFQNNTERGQLTFPGLQGELTALWR